MKKIVCKILGLFAISLFVNANIRAVGDDIGAGRDKSDILSKNDSSRHPNKNFNLLYENPELFKRFMSRLDMIENDIETQVQKKNTSGIIDTITNSTSISLEIEESLKRRLQYISDSLHMSKYHSNISKSIDDLDTLDACLRSVERFTSRADVTKENEQVIFALVLKYVVRVGFLSFKERLNDLQEMQKLHRYWIEQRLHKTYYLLHKSPHKWFFGKSQDIEIDENIKYLESLQETYYEHLGALASHLSKFDPQFEQNKQFEWALELLNRIDGIWGMHLSKKQDVVDVAGFVSTIQKRLARIKEGRKTLQDLTSDVKKPNHFARNWLWYTGAAIVGIAAYKYYQNNPDTVKEFFGMRKKSLVGFWKESIVKPFNGVLDNTICRERIQRGHVSELKQRALNRNDVLMENLRKTMIATSGGSSEGLNFELPDSLDHSYGKKVDEIFTKMSENIKSSDKAMVDQSFVTNPGEKINKIIYTAENKLKPTLFFATETVYSLQETLSEVIDLVYSTIDGQQLNLNLSILTPVLLAGWAGAKGIRELYNKVTNRNFYQLSKYIKDIAILLEEDGRAFSHRKYGKLLFLTHQLKHEIVRLVPKKNNMQQEMLNDTIRIESRQSSIDEKIATLSSMKDHYFPFLYKGAAA